MNRKIMVALVLAALAPAACGRDATAPGAQLSAGEAQALVANLASLSGSAFGSAAAGQAAIASGPTPVSWTFNSTLPCPAGGTVSPDVKVTGQVDAAAHTSSFDLTGTSSYKACASKVETGTIAVTGTLASTAHLAVANLKPNGPETFTQKGSFDWVKSDGTRGSCTVDVTGGMDPLTQKISLSGSFCGHTLS
ncbi:MAG TPA: hypothetical protein VF832_16575 [Longimicrobiales bacterium]